MIYFRLFYGLQKFQFPVPFSSVGVGRNGLSNSCLGPKLKRERVKSIYIHHILRQIRNIVGLKIKITKEYFIQKQLPYLFGSDLYTESCKVLVHVLFSLKICNSND
jgi:hypothetical protein